ncbi:MAG: hypothetical protein ACI4CX_05235, partial [Candidatus Weimeria sp.]
MQTQRESLKENVELNLVDICWKLLMQWRPIIVFSLLIALAVSGLKYYKDAAAYKTSVQTVKEQKTKKTSYTEKDIEKLQDKLSDTELNAVENAVFNQRKILTDQKYLNSSILMQIDSQNKHVVYIDYYISGAKPKFSELLCRSFSSRFYDRDTLKKISKTMNEDINSDDLQKVMGELIDVNYTGTTQSDSMAKGNGYQVTTEVYPVITVSVVLPSDTDSAAVVKAVNSSMKSISKDLNRTVGKHQLNVLESYDKYTVDNDLKDTQNRVKDEILTSQSNNATAIESFTDDQKSLYNAEILNLKDEMGIDATETKNSSAKGSTSASSESDTTSAKESGSDTNSKSDTASGDKSGSTSASDDSLTSLSAEKPSFSKKYCAVGFIGGLFIYIVCYVMLIALRHRVNSGDDITDVTGLRKFGEYHAYTKTGFARFIWSKRVFEFYYRRYLNLEETSKYAADGIKATLTLMKNESEISDRESDAVTILSLDTFTQSAQKYVTSVSKTLTSIGITVDQKQLTIADLLTDAAVVRSLGTVVLAISENQTDYNELDEFVGIAEEYKIPVMG